MRDLYLSELLREEVDHWHRACVVIDAPTGAGKTTFVIENLIDRFTKYETLTQRKVLILCNRRLLRKQYWGQLIEKYGKLSAIENRVILSTYQELAKKVQTASSVNGLFEDVCAVICDEAHYFYADADFNALGTFPLLNAIIRASAGIPLVFLSATTAEILPIIKEATQIQETLFQNEEMRGVNPRRPDWEKITEYSRPADGFRVLSYRFPGLQDFDRFDCEAVPDDETLAQTIARSPGKSVVFIDNRREAETLKNLLVEMGEEDAEIAVLNADTIDSEAVRSVVDALVYTNQLPVKVLITTSVLDNGVSIVDQDVDNVAIVTESKISFLQMLGRVRAGDEGKRIRLIFKVREPELFRERAGKYKRVQDVIGDVKKHPEKYSALNIVQSVWENADPEMTDIYLKIFCPLRPDNAFIPDDRARKISCDGMAIQFKCGETSLYLNRFAIEKIGNMQIAEESFYHEALMDPLNVIYKQMAWIGKSPEDLQLVESVVEKEFVEEALGINGLDADQFQNKKRELVKRFRRYIFQAVNTKNGTVSNEKFNCILNKVGLVLRIDTGEKRHQVYFVERQENAIEDEKGGNDMMNHI